MSNNRQTHLANYSPLPGNNDASIKGDNTPTDSVGLLGPVQIRRLAQKLSVSPTKKFGQNFVHDPLTVRKIVRESGVQPGDVVIEVGPGLGSLTLGILEAGAIVMAVEIDPLLANGLADTIVERMPLAATRFAVACADALKISAASDFACPEILLEKNKAQKALPTHLVANLPYNVAVPVLINMLENIPSIENVLVMVQLEVANRLAAKPGSKIYGVPSVKARWYAHVERASLISRNVFWPVPNVESALVRITRRSEPLGTDSERRAVFELVDSAFATRRKTIRAALGAWAGGAKKAEAILTTAGVDPQKRGEVLAVQDFLNIVRAKCAMEEQK